MIELTRLPDETVGRGIRLAVIFASLGIAFLGIWWVRRHRRSQALRFPTTTNPPFSPYEVN